MKNNKKIIIGIITSVLIIVLAAFFLHSKTKPTKNQEGVRTATSSTTPDLYALPSAERDNFLFMGNQNKDYQFVVNATDDGIKNHKDLVWDDIDFWNHRGMAFYSLGDCADAGAAFYHVLMRNPNDSVASGYIAAILNDKSCDTATSSSDIK